MRGIRGTLRGAGLAAAGCAALVAIPGSDSAGGAGPVDGPRALIGVSTPRQGELRDTVPISRRKGAEPRSVLSLELPRLKPGDRVRFNAEVTATTTCVEALPRCIGRRYGFDPRIRAWVVLAAGARDARGRAIRVAAPDRLTCEQSRPNRNHHCPMVVGDALRVGAVERLPCRPSACRLNVVLAAHHPNARGGEVVVVGADRPDGSVEGGKGRLNAAVARADGDATAETLSGARRRVRKLPASFKGGQRVVYSRRVDGLAAGDVLLVRARQRTRIRGLPYFVASKVVVASRPAARIPSPPVRRIVRRRGTATDTNGFNCTIGASAFRSPCTTRKAGMATLKRAPRDARGRPRPLYVNLVSRTFPKRAQARGAYPPARVLSGGGLVVRHLRASR